MWVCVGHESFRDERERELEVRDKKKKISGVKGEKKKMKKKKNNNNKQFPNGVSDYGPNRLFFKTFGCIW